VQVPCYDELSVKNMYPNVLAFKEVMVYLPDRAPDGRLPERKFFWNILNTVDSHYVGKLIEHAQAQRMTAKQDGPDKNTIEVSSDWWNALHAMPFISCKLTISSLLYEWTTHRSTICCDWPTMTFSQHQNATAV